MTAIFKITDISTATALLTSEFRHVVVRAVYKVNDKVHPKLGKMPQGAAMLKGRDLSQHQIKKWKAKGGALVTYSVMFDEPHDAQILCECPLSTDSLQKVCANTADAVAIYRPPSWSAHERTIERLYPSVDAARNFEAVVRTAGRRQLSKTELAILAALSLPTSNIGCAEERELCSAANIGTNYFKKLRRAIQRGNGSRMWNHVTPVITRIAPRESALLPLYNWLLALPQVNGRRLVLNRSSATLRPLARCGSIEREPRMWFFWKGFGTPDYEKIGKEHEIARGDLSLMMRLIENSPTLTETTLRGLLRSGPQPAPSRSPSAARP